MTCKRNKGLITRLLFLKKKQNKTKQNKKKNEMYLQLLAFNRRNKKDHSEEKDRI